MEKTTWKEEADERRKRRLSVKLTLDDLGKLIQLSAPQLHRYERGKAAARADIIERWNSALDKQEKLLEEESCGNS